MFHMLDTILTRFDQYLNRLAVAYVSFVYRRAA